jgi:hypothetical protein
MFLSVFVSGNLQLVVTTLKLNPAPDCVSPSQRDEQRLAHATCDAFKMRSWVKSLCTVRLVVFIMNVVGPGSGPGWCLTRSSTCRYNSAAMTAFRHLLMTLFMLVHGEVDRIVAEVCSKSFERNLNSVFFFTARTILWCSRNHAM